MGDAQGQGSIAEFVVFLDENHCGNAHLQSALEAFGIRFEKHTDHFNRGVDDTQWIPVVASRNWVLLTADARIRYNSLERQAVRDNSLRMFYFTRNDIAGVEMGRALAKAIPRMKALCVTQAAPFVASISRAGDVNLRETFEGG